MDKGFYVRDNSGLDAYGYEFAACDETGAVHMADTINQLHGIVIKNAQSPYPTAYADMPITALFTGQYMPLRA